MKMLNVFVQPSEEERSFLNKALNDSERLFLVAVSNDNVVGFLTATINKNKIVPFLSKEPICRVGTIVIDQNHRSIGIGQELMKSCNNWAESSGAKEIRLEVMEFNSKAQSFYTKLGWSIPNQESCLKQYAANKKFKFVPGFALHRTPPVAVPLNLALGRNIESVI